MLQNKHREFFDLLAAEWDLMFTAEDIERLSNIVDSINVKNGMDIVDIGCGTGIMFDLLRRKTGLNGSVTGVDFSLPMAMRTHRNLPVSNVNVVDADAIDLPFIDSCFDIGVAFSSFPHFSNQQQAIKEIHRVLKDGAKFHIIHLVSSNELSEIHQRIGGVVKHDAIPREETLRKMFNGNKFSSVTVDDHPGLYLATAINFK